MNTFDWIVLSAVLAALAVAIAHIVRVKKRGCSGCGECQMCGGVPVERRADRRAAATTTLDP
ncbi:MAG: FeoB-associated Cys-rich membrane protein [Kiritimatiellaeota bacterium]|nr:FeoB-associated Cys-rich membrane protein [Kiritimatiellota bacterium]